MEKIKKHWKEILIALLVIFSLNKCTVACNRNSKINKQLSEISYKDSVIKVKNDSLSILKIRWDDAQKSQSTYQGIALGNQNSLIDEVNTLNGEINSLQKQNDQLKAELNSLKKKLHK